MEDYSNLPGVGNIAGPDDVAPEGEIITVDHVLIYRASVELAYEKAGMPAPTWD